MTKDEFIAQLDRATAMMSGLPVSCALLLHLSDSLKKGEPNWWKNTQKAWENRKFVSWTESWGLFLTAVHADVLGDAESPLAHYFPSCGGTAEADPTTVFARYLNDLPRAFFSKLRDAHRRTFVEQRAPLWIPPAASYFQRRKLPFYLVEINAGAGLNLAADLLYPQKSFDSSLIAARIGMEPMPLQLEEVGDRRWLTAALMPEELASIQEIDRAMDLVAKRMRQEAAFIQLVPCPTEKAPAFLAKNIPSDDKDVGLMVVNMGTTVRMSDPEYRSFHKAMAALLDPWGDRGLWLEIENVRGEMYSTTYQGLLHKPAAGALEEFVMVRYDFASKKVDFDPELAEKFLTVSGRS